jgi:septum formation protein
MHALPFILASASPRRVALLQMIGAAPAKILPADIDETPLPRELPEAYAQRVATAKAAAIAERAPGEIILSADTVVAMGRRILPKAEDEATARQCMALLSGRRHRVLTAICVIDRHGKKHEKLVRSAVRFSRLSAAQMEDYIASGEWNGKAGGYAIQGRAAAFIPFLSGSHSSVVGLPLAETAAMLTRVGAL